MSERIPTPSTELSKVATQRDIDEHIPAGEPREYNLLEAEEAAYAAKPFMDVAVELYGAQEDKELALENSNFSDLGSLIDYAERRARFAAEKGEVRELSDDEQKILDVYKAQAESDKVKLALGDTYLDIGPKDAISASIEANDRFKQATTREERRKWVDMEQKLERYADYLHTGNDNNDKEFSIYPGYTGGLLDRMDAKTGNTREWDGKPIDGKKLLLRAHNLRTEADMLRFLGEHMVGNRSNERATNNETASELHKPHYNVAETVTEAKALIYGNPDLLGELIEESEAYAKFSADKLGTSNAAISSNLKTMERDLPEVRQAVQDWRETSGMSFKQYIEVVSAGDIKATQDQQNAAYSAKMMLRNRFWRESSMARRMARKIGDKSETGDIDTAFGAGYFSQA